MRKLFVAIGIAGLGILGSCTPGAGGERFTYMRGKQGVLIMDSQSGEVYRLKIDQNGETKWEFLGSPKDAK